MANGLIRCSVSLRLRGLGEGSPRSGNPRLVEHDDYWVGSVSLAWCTSWWPICLAVKACGLLRSRMKRFGPDSAPPTTEAVIEVSHLSKAYGSTVAVDDVSFSVRPGEIFGILGPNGAGKTTTVECVQGLRRPNGGTIRVLGLDPTSQAAQLRQRIGSQLQDSALPARLRVPESIELFAAFAHHPVDCDQLLTRWRLGDQRAQAFDSLSGGQRQRLFIALAFVNSPEVVFLDELTQGLDPQARRATWELRDPTRR
jgi:ABC-type Na+ transport system ATPase subunit NatA